MQFTRSVTANFKQLIYAAVYSFMPIYRWAEGYSCSFRAAFPFVQPLGRRLFFEPTTRRGSLPALCHALAALACNVNVPTHLRTFRFVRRRKIPQYARLTTRQIRERMKIVLLGVCSLRSRSFRSSSARGIREPRVREGRNERAGSRCAILYL